MAGNPARQSIRAKLGSMVMMMPVVVMMMVTHGAERWAGKHHEEQS